MTNYEIRKDFPIFENQDISKGIIVFINHNEDEIIQIVKKFLLL